MNPISRALAALRARVRALEADTLALYLASRDPRVPWHAKAVAAITVAYALSPIDLIPDFIPVLGYLDDLVLIPMGLALAIRLIPPAILAEHRPRDVHHADQTAQIGRHRERPLHERSLIVVGPEGCEDRGRSDEVLSPKPEPFAGALERFFELMG